LQGAGDPGAVPAARSRGAGRGRKTVADGVKVAATPASPLAVLGPGTLAAYWRFHQSVTQAQVRAWLLKVLRGQVAAVVRDLRGKGQAAGLKGNKAKELHKVCGYLHKRRRQMRYHEYLKAGYPIASGVIEGACRHYVKDRMERTGMSWRQQGAQAMLQLRSVALDGDWDDFQDFYRRRQGEALYPHRSLLEEITWPLAA